MIISFLVFFIEYMIEYRVEMFGILDEDWVIEMERIFELFGE